MPVITTDILLTGIRRDDVFEWMGDPANHAAFLNGAFDGFEDQGGGVFALQINAAGKTRTMGYRFAGKDDSHGGRRILVDTDGKRTRGKLNYSLRTMKPSTNTLVTIRLDYEAGGPLGGIVAAAGLSDALERGFKAVLNNLSGSIPRSN